MRKIVDVLEHAGLCPLPAANQDAVTTVLWMREKLQEHIATTYKVDDPEGIDELKPVSINGRQQWLHIRGRSRSNPVLLYLHGGPGDAMIGYMDSIQRPWEDYFTVVHWDQRQAGKSFYSADSESESLRLEFFADDAKQIIKYLREYLDKEKLFLLGHSWGSVVGMHVVKKVPEWIYAYIGIGQIVNQMDSENVIYTRLRDHAVSQEKQDIVDRVEKAIVKLNTGSPDREETFVENCSFVRCQLSLLARETGCHHLPYTDIVRILSLERFLSPHITEADLVEPLLSGAPALLRPSCRDYLTKDFLDVDLPNQLGSSFEVPIFFFTGRHDYQTPITLSDRWFKNIQSPHKELIHFENSSHMLINEEPGKFLVELVGRVLPMAQRASVSQIAASRRHV